jgi:hypothetical protein
MSSEPYIFRRSAASLLYSPTAIPPCMHCSAGTPRGSAASGRFTLGLAPACGETGALGLALLGLRPHGTRKGAASARAQPHARQRRSRPSAAAADACAHARGRGGAGVAVWRRAGCGGRPCARARPRSGGYARHPPQAPGVQGRAASRAARCGRTRARRLRCGGAHVRRGLERLGH